MPTAPIKAKTPSSPINWRVLAIAASGSYASSRDRSASLRPCTPPCRFASPNAASMPSRRVVPRSRAGPLKAADCPNRICRSETPVSSALAAAAPASAADAATRTAAPKQAARLMRFPVASLQVGYSGARSAGATATSRMHETRMRRSSAARRSPASKREKSPKSTLMTRSDRALCKRCRRIAACRLQMRSPPRKPPCWLLSRHLGALQ